MKKFLVIALIVVTKGAFAQKDTVGLNIPFANNTIVYEKVFEVPSNTKNLLYSNAGLWLAGTHPYEDTQLQLADPALSRVAGRVKSADVVGNKVLWNTQYYTITYNFTLQVDCKDNKYRIRIYNIQDVAGNTYTPADNLMLSLINSKSYAITDNNVLKTADLKQRFRSLNTIVSNVMADVSKGILTADSSF